MARYGGTELAERFPNLVSDLKTDFFRRDKSEVKLALARPGPRAAPRVAAPWRPRSEPDGPGSCCTFISASMGTF